MRLLPILLCLACTGATQAPHPDPPPAGKVTALPEGGSLQAMDRLQLAAHMRAPAPLPRIFNVWATWCAPCVAEMPALEAFADAHEGQVELWYINTDHPKVAVKQLPRFLQKHGLQDRHHIRQHASETDLTADIPDFPQVLPVTYIVSPAGETMHRYVGAVDASHLANAIAP